jgi:hypothetical protein
MSPRYFFSVFVLSFLILTGHSCAQDKIIRTMESIAPDSVVSIEFKDGTVLKGKITSHLDSTLVIETMGGIEAKALITTVLSIKPLYGHIIKDTFYRYDPNYSRLMFGPTGRPLKKGDGYLTDYYVFFPGVAYGFTNNFSVLAGFSILPGAGLKDQLKYVAPRFGKQFSDQFALSAGVFYLGVSDFGLGVAFASGTYGYPDKSFTLGIGYGYYKDDDEKFNFADYPIIMLGGNVRLSHSTAFITETWLITGVGVKLSQQPFAFAIRLFGDRLAADLGFIVVGEVIQHGFPIPWLSIVYNFNR